jgi:hypothetical protein
MVTKITTITNTKKPSMSKALKKVTQKLKEKKVNINEKQIANDVASKLKKLVIGKTLHTKSDGLNYLDALLYPECAHGAKIPGLCDATIPIRRKVTYNLTTNALGAAGIVWQPFMLSDTTAALTTFFTNVNSTYDGVTTIGSASPTAVYISQAITPSAVQAYRLVSASISIIPQASILNQAGSIHGSVIRDVVNTPKAAAAVYTGATNCTLLPNFENSVFYKEASISALEGMRIVVLPMDPCFLEFYGINENLASYEGAAAQECNTVVVDIVGTAASTAVRIDLCWNFEIVPAPNSILLGMESMCEDDTIPNTVWRKVLTSHFDEIVTVGRSVNSSAIRNKTQSSLSSGLDYQNGRLQALQEFIDQSQKSEVQKLAEKSGFNYNMGSNRR